MRIFSNLAVLAAVLVSGPLFAAVGAPAAAQSERGSGSGSANGAPVVSVIELFTSQGCSSCPPADALLESYTRRPDIVALTYPVDYWDYLGWKDTLASPKHAARQRDYAKQRGDGRIYTPQAVINGLLHVTGSSAPYIDRALGESRKMIAPYRVAVKLASRDGQLVIDLSEGAPGAVKQEGTVWLALIRRRVDVEIGRGENRGRTVSYFNVVRDIMPVGMWSGKPATIQLAHHALKDSGAEGCAVLVQKGKGGPVLGAAVLASW